MRWVFLGLRLWRLVRRPSLGGLLFLLLTCQGLGTATALVTGLPALLAAQWLAEVPSTIPMPASWPTSLEAFLPTSMPSLWPATAARCRLRGARPDPGCTPGAVDPRVTQANIRSTICKAGYTETMKREAMKQYGLKDRLSNYEYDHLIPLSSGGCPACATNLFPQPYAGPYGAHEKDKVKVYLQSQVCSGKMLLAAAQHAIATDWVAVYDTLPSVR